MEITPSNALIRFIDDLYAKGNGKIDLDYYHTMVRGALQAVINEERKIIVRAFDDGIEAGRNIELGFSNLGIDSGKDYYHSTYTNEDSELRCIFPGTFFGNIFNAAKSEWVLRAKAYAIKCHAETNHKYDGDKPYEVHLQMVVDYIYKYSHLLGDYSLEVAIAAGWTHDVIEDCRQTYNDVKNQLGEQVADIVYALTNEKGKNRKERANASYYKGIVDTPIAAYVKMCDRLANVKYSKDNGSRMLDAYRNEYQYFKDNLYDIKLQPMWLELAELLKVN